MPDLSLAGKIIAELKEAGFSYSKIAKIVGRDASYVSQVGRGIKPGSGLELALGQIQRGEDVDVPERRKTKSGEPAKVRQSKKENPAPRLLKDKEGRIKNAPETSKEWVFLNRLDKIAQAGGKVSFRVKTEGGREFVLFSKGGIYAQKANYEIRNHEAGAFDWLREQAENLGGNLPGASGLTFVGKVVSVEINAIY